MKLLNLENAKTPKGEKLGYLTGILYLAPNTQSDVTNVCPMAIRAGCIKACLYSAGRGKFTNVKEARIRKTRFFHEKKNAFMNELALDISSLVKQAKKKEAIPLVRLNGTSDILWEDVPFFLEKKTAEKIGRISTMYPNVMALFPEIQFYDYTKIARRTRLPKNYDLTFSYSGTPKFEKEVQKAIQNGMRIAVVFRKKENMPATFLNKRVLPGDETDLRHLEPKDVIVSLYAKGDARKDTTGFVVDVAT